MTRKAHYRKHKKGRRKKKAGSRIPGWVWLVMLGTVLVVLGVVAALRPSGGAAEIALASPEVLAQGAAVYSETCAACHGAEGEGNVGPALNGSMHSWHHVDDQLRSVILDGRPGTAMVGHRGHLTEEDVDAVISYFKAWWTPEQRAMQRTGQHPMP